MQQYLTALASLADNNVNKQHCYARNNRQAFLWLRDSLSSESDWFVEQCMLEFTRVRMCIWLWTPFGWKIKFVSGNCERSTWVYTADGEDIQSSGLEQASDGLYAEVLLWCASGPIARRWIVPTCVWKLFDCKNRSECWKNSIGVSVPRPCGLNVHVCSKSCWLCLTVVYWLFGVQ
jgi:hypothetical protein